VAAGLEYLFSKQEADGAWRGQSTPLKSGRALTPFVLASVGSFSDERLSRWKPETDRALAAVLQGVGEETEYPNYSRALAILALQRFRPPGGEAAVRRMAKELIEKQIRRAGDDPLHGAWDLGAPVVSRPDVSVTAFVLEALKAAGSLEEPVRQAALAFVARCRASEGGYFFTTDPTQSFQNKAGPDRGYASATSDAVRCLRACGVPDEDPRVAAALEWLRLNPSLDYAAGIPLEMPERIGEGLLFYSLYARQRARGDVPGLRAKLAALQREDGSWRNPVGIMKEDDPVLATALALGSLAE